jgi:hypothetical protein
MPSAVCSMGLKPLPLLDPLSLSDSSAQYGRIRSGQLKLGPLPLINYRPGVTVTQTKPVTPAERGEPRNHDN